MTPCPTTASGTNGIGGPVPPWAVVVRASGAASAAGRSPGAGPPRGGRARGAPPTPASHGRMTLVRRPSPTLTPAAVGAGPSPGGPPGGEGRLEPGVPGQRDDAGNLTGVPTRHDDRRPLVDAAIHHAAGLVVVGIRRTDHASAEP